MGAWSPLRVSHVEDHVGPFWEPVEVLVAIAFDGEEHVACNSVGLDEAVAASAVVELNLALLIAVVFRLGFLHLLCQLLGFVSDLIGFRLVVGPLIEAELAPDVFTEVGNRLPGLTSNRRNCRAALDVSPSLVEQSLLLADGGCSLRVNY